MASRRHFIQSTMGAALLPVFQTGAAPYVKGQYIDKSESIIGHGEYLYKVDRNWAKISVTSTPLFNCHEMVQDSKGRLIMLSDHTRNNLLIFDKSGKLLDCWGTAYPGGHGLTLPKKEGKMSCLSLTVAGIRTAPENGIAKLVKLSKRI